jgi:RNA polymerase sigma-54 factor
VRKNLAYQITDYIDDNGYLSVKLKELALELKVGVVLLRAVLKELQAFDPIGVYSVDLQDCLRLQAKDQGYYSENFAILVDNLDLLAKFDMELLQKKCGVKAAVLKEMVQQLQSLNPKPGLAYSNALAQVVVPEIIFEKDDSGELKVFLNKSDMPKVCFHQSYYMDLKTDLDAEAKLFIKENKRLAANLINALDKRSALLMRFGVEMLDMQYEFFKCGQDYLKPMTIKEMAKRLDVHESTVSRLSNKYVQTMYGILPIKFFFSSKLANVYTEEDNSSRAVKKQICDLVAAEDVNKVLSDRQLCDILCSKYNVVISRRTVAKYREELRIAPSVVRKKQKKML